MREYCNGSLASARSRLPADGSKDTKPSYWGSVAEHREILHANERLLPELAKSPLLRAVSKPTLLHADLHMRNIFISETRPFGITAIIDWQSTAVEPAFMYANETPDFASRQVEDEDEDEDDTNEESPDPPSPQTKAAKSKTKQDILLCNEAFEVCMDIGQISANHRQSPQHRPITHTTLSPL
jgi:hypothetical protein